MLTKITQTMTIWKLRHASDLLNNDYKKYYPSSENVAVDEVIVLFKGRTIFK